MVSIITLGLQYKNTNRRLKIEYTKVISQSGSKC